MVRKGSKPPKVRTWYSFQSLASTYEYVVHNNSLINVKRGLVERVFCVKGPKGQLIRPPRPVQGHLKNTLERYVKVLSGLVRNAPSMTRQEFVDSYAGSRRVVYQRALDTLGNREVTVEDSHLKTFVKAEKINMTLKPDPAPRVIQPRDPRYNIEVGRYLKPIEKPLMHAIDEVFGEVTAIKGYTVERVGKILHEKSLQYRHPVFVGLDASRFDQHCSREALEWEHSIYNTHFRSKRLAQLLKFQLVNKGVAYTNEGKIKYTVEGCRMSGDMNTSMGNYLLMSMMIHAYLKDIGLKASLANCGDDCVLIFEREDLRKLGTLNEWFTKMGYTMKIEKPVFHLEQVEFCQMHPVMTADRGYVMVRRPDVVMTKDVGVVRGGMTMAKLQDWLCAQHSGGLSLAGDIPILGRFYERFPEGDCHGTISDMEAPHKFTAGSKSRIISDECRYSFWLAFGLLPDEQLAIEDELLSWEPNLGHCSALVKQVTLLDFCSR